MASKSYECTLCYVQSTVSDSMNRVGYVVDSKECEKGYKIPLCPRCSSGLRLATPYQLELIINRFKGDVKRLPDDVKSNLAMLRLIMRDDDRVINKDLGQIFPSGISLVIADLEERVSQSDTPVDDGGISGNADGDPHA